jgi:hypothetical protein
MDSGFDAPIEIIPSAALTESGTWKSPSLSPNSTSTNAAEAAVRPADQEGEVAAQDVLYRRANDAKGL